jgi:hypothetical protein
LGSVGKDRQFGTADDRLMDLALATYDAAARTVRLKPAQALKITQPFALRVTGTSGLTDEFGVPLDGNFDGVPGGNSTWHIGEHSLPDTKEKNSTRIERIWRIHADLIGSSSLHAVSNEHASVLKRPALLKLQVNLVTHWMERGDAGPEQYRVNVESDFVDQIGLEQ